MTTPRLRPELSATPAEEQGIKFFDVSDPHSGNKMRMYDFEWLLAAQMDGQRSFEDIAGWARSTLQLEVSTATLDEYARRLSQLGFFASAESAAPAQGRVSLPSTSNLTPLPPPAPGDADYGEDLPLQLSEDMDEEVTIQHTALPPRSHDAAARADATVPNAPKPSASPVSATPTPTPTPVGHGPEVSATGAKAGAERSSSGSMMGLILVVLLLAAVVAYVMFFSGGGSAAKVSIVVAKPGDVVRLHDGSAKLEKTASRSLSFGEAGKVLDIVAAGTEVKLGMPLATLEAYTKVEKELADVKDRLGFYQKQLEAALAKTDAEAQKSAESKVAEKKKLLGELEARALKLRLFAQGPGVVDKVHVAAGAEAKANEPVIEVTEKNAAATFTVVGELAATAKVGDEVTLQRTQGGAAVVGRVAKLEGDKLTVEVADESAADGEVRLVKSRLSGVIALPLTAVVKKGTADVVFVLGEGTVHEKRVTIADRTGTEAYVSSGISAGETVVTSNPAALHDGQSASQ